MRRALLSALTVVAVFVAPTAAPVPANAAPLVPYRPPVDGEVVREFEMLADHYAAGSHRGVDLAAEPGDAVRAAGPGRVSFVGAVANDTWVSIAHPDGIVTSYGALSHVLVTEGAEVGGGDIIGAARGDHRADAFAQADDGLHWGARRDGVYLDPLSLLVDLVPTLVGPGGWEGSHPRVEGWDWRPDPSGLGIHPAPTQPATTPGAALPPNRNHPIAIRGMGSSTADGSLRLGLLGYGHDRTDFSWAGCVESDGVCSPVPYGPDDTNLHIEDALDLLDELLRERQRRQPHRPVDLVGHSMGGELATHYLATRYDPSDIGLPPIGHTVAIASPHAGSPMADLADAVGGHVVSLPIELARRAADGLGVPGVGDVGFGGAAQARYRRGGPAAHGSPAARSHDLVETMTVAGTRDWVVPPSSALRDGGVRFVVDGTHGEVARSEAVLGAVHEFLAGGEPVGEPLSAAAPSEHNASATRLDAVAIRLTSPFGFVRNLVRGRVSPTDVSPGANTLAPQPPGRAATRDPRTGRRLPIWVEGRDADGEPTGVMVPLDPSVIG